MPFGENLRWILTKRNITPKEIAEVINVKVNTISNYTNGVSTPNYDLLDKIVKFLDVSADDILFGDLPGNDPGKKNAPIFAPNAAPNENFSALTSPKIVTVNQDGIDNIVLVSAKAATGYLNGYNQPEYMETLPAYQIPGFENGTFRMFEVNGHSMMPTLKNRDKIIGKWCELADVKDAYVHILITRNDGIVIKRVLNRIKKDGVLILKSDSNGGEYPDMVIDPADIIESWAGVCKISRDLSDANNLYSRLDDAEGRLAIIEKLLKHK
jgi:transcriptional regulator with XRE-family HTH domain